MLAVKKFIKDKVGNLEDDTVSRVRDWLYMQVAGRLMPEKFHPRQYGCPDLVPGLSLSPWWERDNKLISDFISKLESKADIIREELLALR